MEIENIQTVIELKNQLDEAKRQLALLIEFNYNNPVYLSSQSYDVTVLDDIVSDVVKKVGDSLLNRIEDIKKQIKEL